MGPGFQLNCHNRKKNPLFESHDPSMMWDPISETFYSYATDTAINSVYQQGIPVRKSKDLVHFTYEGIALSAKAIEEGRNNGVDYEPTGGFWAPSRLLKWCNWEIRQVIWDTYLEIAVLENGNRSLPESVAGWSFAGEEKMQKSGILKHVLDEMGNDMTPEWILFDQHDNSQKKGIIGNVPKLLLESEVVQGTFFDYENQEEVTAFTGYTEKGDCFWVKVRT